MDALRETMPFVSISTGNTTLCEVEKDSKQEQEQEQNEQERNIVDVLLLLPSSTVVELKQEHVNQENARDAAADGGAFSNIQLHSDDAIRPSASFVPDNGAFIHEATATVASAIPSTQIGTVRLDDCTNSEIANIVHVAPHPADHCVARDVAIKASPNETFLEELPPHNHEKGSNTAGAHVFNAAVISDKLNYARMDTMTGASESMMRGRHTDVNAAAGTTLEHKKVLDTLVLSGTGAIIIPRKKNGQFASRTPSEGPTERTTVLDILVQARVSDDVAATAELFVANSDEGCDIISANNTIQRSKLDENEVECADLGVTIENHSGSQSSLFPSQSPSPESLNATTELPLRTEDAVEQSKMKSIGRGGFEELSCGTHFLDSDGALLGDARSPTECVMITALDEWYARLSHGLHHELMQYSALDFSALSPWKFCCKEFGLLGRDHLLNTRRIRDTVISVLDDVANSAAAAGDHDAREALAAIGQSIVDGMEKEGSGNVITVADLGASGSILGRYLYSVEIGAISGNVSITAGGEVGVSALWYSEFRIASKIIWSEEDDMSAALFCAKFIEHATGRGMIFKVKEIFSSIADAIANTLRAGGTRKKSGALYVMWDTLDAGRITQSS